MTTTTHQFPSPGSPSGTSQLAVSAQHLVKNYGKGETAVAALRDVSIDFAKGRFTAIMGPSGSGKSTLMHLLAGLDTADSGHIHLGDTEITGLNDTQLTTLRRENVGFVFQAFNLVPTLTAEQNILLPIELAGGKADLEWFDFIVDVLGLKDRLKHRPHELSGGSSSASPSHAPCSPGRTCCSAMSPPATWTPAPARRSSPCSAAAARNWGRPSSWSPTTRSPRATPTA